MWVCGAEKGREDQKDIMLYLGGSSEIYHSKKQLVECTKINKNYDSFQLVALLLEIYQNEVIKEAHTGNVFGCFGT